MCVCVCVLLLLYCTVHTVSPSGTVYLSVYTHSKYYYTIFFNFSFNTTNSNINSFVWDKQNKTDNKYIESAEINSFGLHLKG